MKTILLVVVVCAVLMLSGCGGGGGGNPPPNNPPVPTPKISGTITGLDASIKEPGVVLVSLDEDGNIKDEQLPYAPAVKDGEGRKFTLEFPPVPSGATVYYLAVISEGQTYNPGVLVDFSREFVYFDKTSSKFQARNENGDILSYDLKTDQEYRFTIEVNPFGVESVMARFRIRP